MKPLFALLLVFCCYGIVFSQSTTEPSTAKLPRMNGPVMVDVNIAEFENPVSYSLQNLWNELPGHVKKDEALLTACKQIGTSDNGKAEATFTHMYKTNSGVVHCYAAIGLALCRMHSKGEWSAIETLEDAANDNNRQYLNGVRALFYFEHFADSLAPVLNNFTDTANQNTLLYLKAYAYINDGHSDSALTIARQITADWPYPNKRNYLLAEIFVGSPYEDSALYYLNRISSFVPHTDTLAYLRLLATKYMCESNYEKAIPYMEDMYWMDRSYTTIDYEGVALGLFEANFYLGNMEEAVSYFQSVPKNYEYIDPADYRMAIQAYTRLGNKTKAAQVLQRAKRRWPKEEFHL